MGLFIAAAVVFLIYYVASGRAAWLFSAIQSLPFLVCAGIWLLVVTVLLVADGWSPVLLGIMLASIAIAIVTAGRRQEGGCCHVESGWMPEPESGNEELLAELRAEPEKEAMLRAWANERSELHGKKPISAASPAEREKNRLLGEISIERIQWLARRKDTPSIIAAQVTACGYWCASRFRGAISRTNEWGAHLALVIIR